MQDSAASADSGLTCEKAVPKSNRYTLDPWWVTGNDTAICRSARLCCLISAPILGMEDVCKRQEEV